MQQTIEHFSDDDHDDEIRENKNEFSKKKPNSVTAILGRDGGMMKKQQSQ